MTKHTPGPWRWFIQGNGDVYLSTEHSGRLLIMDFVRHRFQSAIVRLRDHERCIMHKADHWVTDRTSGTIEHPDARLIAAAPDLLAACEAAYEAMHKLANRLSDVGAYGYPEDLQGGENPATFQALSAAIAKARGDV